MTRCVQHLINDFLKPHFLPTIRPKHRSTIP